MEKEFTLKLTKTELEYILGVLADRPLKEVLSVFRKLEMQAHAQLSNTPDTKPE